ncbi:MAG TPA: hypothetical protein VN132_16175, partial [Bdellovibrio sp.]|nr:hypothetical protein [Bdellovibrio sp.]
GTVTVTIAQNADGQPTVSFKVLGGFSHREMLTGPFVATKRPQIESAVYSFKDQNGELGSVSLVTSAIGGSLHTTASINYSSFKSNLALPCKVVKAQ